MQRLQDVLHMQMPKSDLPMTSQDSFAHMRSMSTGVSGPCAVRFSIRRSAMLQNLGNKALQKFDVIYRPVQSCVTAKHAVHKVVPMNACWESQYLG